MVDTDAIYYEGEYNRYYNNILLNGWKKEIGKVMK
jgi:hypothetical protein